MAGIGVDIRPEGMGITWADVDATLLDLRAFVRNNELPYGIAHDFEAGQSFLRRLRDVVERG
jgi:hypothetical protein